ncbi:Zinc-type alcohol dehydrogenase-like protein [Colletotrichum siamense]|uniref:Zinc-type alcohol dehydrogenase-like protein n=1 Tax=Colletotrichum siamense TaxID=690259 RepID=UPI0018722F32|nr:Zinc-type alcohol dehydrogenase-like protein [Colletotrichum siamense]KAF5516046.1 Zinc-type alcohol dehydrogenase-like protein [Colletotrichum siamense]
MSQSLPKTTKQWNVVDEGGLASLRFSEQPVPDLGDNEVLVKLHGAAINFRDLVIHQGKYPWHVKPNVIPGSDGAGVVLAVGKHFGLGAGVDGTFRTVGVFNEQGLVTMPEGINFIEAASLSCAGVTAWNALFGLEGKKVSAGQWILTQGTGGVSLFAVQFAKAVGARVIATTSSDEKAEILKRLGADHIINYRNTTDWGVAAKRLTGGVGVDLVVEIAGNSTLKQSVASVKLDGTVVTAGFAGGDGQDQGLPTLLDTWLSLFTARGVWVGSRLQMEEMCKAVEANPDKLRPVLDPKIFKLEDLELAYQYLQTGRHQGKVGIEIS